MSLVDMRTLFLRVAITLVFAITTVSFAEAGVDLSKIKLPAGYEISIFADNLEGARSLTRGTEGTYFVGSRDAGKVYALVDSQKKGKADKIYTIASGLNEPNGVAFSEEEGALYVAEISRILKFPNIEKHLSKPPKPVVVYDKLPKDKHHGWKFIAFGPDGYLYVPVGAPCNICEREDPRYATIMRMKKNGTDVEIFAKGVRNSVGFDWHPVTKKLWFTDNGRDWLGDDAPPDELNYAHKKGLNFGFPYCHGGFISDPEFGAKHPCSEFEKPAMKLGPHVASLGMRFWNKDRIIIAEHGSWNRTNPIGYRITQVSLSGDQAIKYEVFAEGWLQPKGEVMGRPVDVLTLDEGTLLVSDDHAGVVYRIGKKK